MALPVVWDYYRAMLRRSIRNLLFALLTVSLFAISAVSQQTCPLPPSIQPVSHEANIFSDRQEIDLGDAMADSIGQRTKVIYDESLNAYLRKVGERLVQHLPPSQMKFRFYLIELPEVNAFSIAGGRVYVSRKIVALAKTDDELAGVLAHELGHIVTHQSAIETTSHLRVLLNVTQVSDRTDIFDKFHRLLENEARLRGRSRDREEGQYVADQVALYAMARAGYAPHAYVDLWDRFQQTHGKTGNWLSDIFGTTKPSERRLREMLKNVSALPAGCAEIPPNSLTEEFAKWQAEVVSYSGLSNNESLPGLVFKQTLSLPLRPDVSNLHFSPDGKYVLAQDEGGIHVLTRDPFAVLFYIPALDSSNAAFTADSRSIVFHNRSLRVESWSVADQKRTSVHELTVLHPCVQTELSRDGSTLACLNSELELSLMEVASGRTLATKKSFVEPTLFGSCLAATALMEGDEARLIEMKFSPDGHYFVAGAYSAHFAWDLSSHREVSLPGSVKDALRASFTFLGADRMIGIATLSPSKSSILRFPSGERLGQVALASNLTLQAVAHGDYILVGPTKKGAMGLFDVKTGKIPITFKTKAGDFYDGIFVAERLSGELALHALPKADTVATVRLPQARLAAWRAAAVSDDFNWMAISNRSRGAIWDVIHNIRTIEMRSFHGAWFAADHTAYFDFPKFLEDERQIGRLDPVTGSFLKGYKVGDSNASQYGPYLLVAKARGEKNNIQIDLTGTDLCMQMFLLRIFRFGGGAALNQDMELRDVRDGHVVWSHYFPHEVPALSFYGGRALLKWSMADTAARKEAARFPELKHGTENTDYLLEEIDLQNDKVVGKIVIKTNKGSFSLTHAFILGDWVIASASHDQILTYSMSTGQQKGHFFGTHSSASANGLLALETESGHLSVYELEGSRLRQQYTFPDPLSFSTFSRDGKRLFVMTASQTAYILDLTATNQANRQGEVREIVPALP